MMLIMGSRWSTECPWNGAGHAADHGTFCVGVVSTDKFIEIVEIFQQLHTCSNHPVSSVAALKNTEIMQRENFVENSHNMGYPLSQA